MCLLCRWLRFLSARHAVHRHCETNVSERFIFCLQQNTRTTSFSNASMPGQALTHIERTQLSSSSAIHLLVLIGSIRLLSFVFLLDYDLLRLCQHVTRGRPNPKRLGKLESTELLTFYTSSPAVKKRRKACWLNIRRA